MPGTVKPAEVDLADAVSAMLQGMFDGDRAVTTASRELAEFHGRALYPHRYVVQRIAAELSFEATNDKRWRFLWYEKKRSERPSVLVRVRMELEPNLDPMESRPVSGDHVMAVPQFLVCAGDAESLELKSVNGGLLQVDFGSAGEIVIRVDGVSTTVAPIPAPQADGATPVDPSEIFLPAASAWPMGAIVALLDTVAEWRHGRIPTRNLRFQLAKGLGGDLDSLMSTILAGCNQVARVIESERDRAWINDLVNVSVLSGTVRIHLENEGKLARSPLRPGSSQQLDLVVSPGAVTEDGATMLTFDLPDFLVEGELYEQFLEAIRNASDGIRDALKARRAGVDRATRPDVSQIRDLLQASRVPSNASVIRVSHDDTDLILLRDKTDHGLNGLLLEVKFARKDGVPIVDEKVKILLVAHLKEGIWHGSLHDELDKLKAPYYFARLLRTLHALQKCVAADLA